MTYIVMEIQAPKEGTAVTLVTAHDTINNANTKYHAILSVAAESQVYNHSAVLLTSSGDYLKSEGYIHETVAE